MGTQLNLIEQNEKMDNPGKAGVAEAKPEA
jgi:hypothetical protein